jgi:hypothetical protein
LDERFHYILALPNHEPNQFTFLGGFTPGLMGFQWALQKIAASPVDLWEPALPESARVNRKISGQGGHRWMPLNADVLPMLPSPDTDPLWVIFTQDPDTAEVVERWCGERLFRPLHVSTIKVGKAIPPERLTRGTFKSFALEAIQAEMNPRLVAAYTEAVRRWPAQKFKRTTLRYESHNVTVPNELVLLGHGLLPAKGRRLEPLDDRDYVRAIRDSAQAVRRLRAKGTPSPMLRAYPAQPDTVLFAPAMYNALYRRARLPEAPLDGLAESLRMLQSQRGYAFQTDKPAEILAHLTPGWHLLNSMRSSELRITSAGVGMFCSSVLACGIRLPARINRTQSVVAQLAKHLRKHPSGQDKTGRVFALVQSELANSLDPALRDIIGSSTDGVRLVTDAPLEWLPVGGLPLSLRHQTSRINATPGNLSFGELVNGELMIMKLEALQEVLLISAFAATDGLRHLMRDALAAVASRIGITVRHVEVGSRAELVDALNAFRGVVAVIDSHGDHGSGGAGTLTIGEDDVDAWTLRGHARIPPVMILSACDTHAVDGSHASVTNGFIACGARAVLGTFLPVRGVDAAHFVARLLMHAHSRTRELTGKGYSVSWGRLVTESMRLQLMADVVAGLRRRWKAAAQNPDAVLTMAADRVGEADWWEAFLADLSIHVDLGGGDLEDRVGRIIAASDVIRYVHMGAPETILFSSEAVLATASRRGTRKACLLTPHPS